MQNEKYLKCPCNSIFFLLYNATKCPWVLNPKGFNGESKTRKRERGRGK